LTIQFYRPSTHNILQAVIDSKGHPVAWRHRIVGADVFGQIMPEVIMTLRPDNVPRFIKNGTEMLLSQTVPRIIPGKKAVLGAGPLPYSITHIQVEFINDDPGIPLGWWRSVAHSSNCFAVERFIDEIAATTGTDPFVLRCELLEKNPRLLAVVKLAAEKAEWHAKRNTIRAIGLACHDFQQTMMAMVAEVSIDIKKNIIVHKIYCALDCGIAANPRHIKAQIKSCVAFGLTATLMHQITIRNGVTEQSNFDDYPLLRFDEMPEVETFIIKSNSPPTGIGEAGVPLVGPAVANAVYAATGKPVRSLPIKLDS
jgi:CO/xanthine dehydrogenase Mo-binding subunit